MEAEGSEPSSESSSKELLQTYQDLIRRRGKNPEKIIRFGSGISHPDYRIVGIESHYNTGDPPRDEKGRCLRFFRREAAKLRGPQAYAWGDPYAIAGAIAPSNLNTFARIGVRKFNERAEHLDLNSSECK